MKDYLRTFSILKKSMLEDLVAEIGVEVPPLRFGHQQFAKSSKNREPRVRNLGANVRADPHADPGANAGALSNPDGGADGPARLRPPAHKDKLTRATTHHSFGGSFFSGSTPIFTIKDAFYSIFQNLQNLHTSAGLET